MRHARNRDFSENSTTQNTCYRTAITAPARARLLRNASVLIYVLELTLSNM